MKNVNDLAAFLLPILFVILCIRVGLEAIGPAILPLAVAAFVALVAWLWMHRMR